MRSCSYLPLFYCISRHTSFMATVLKQCKTIIWYVHKHYGTSTWIRYWKISKTTTKYLTALCFSFRWFQTDTFRSSTFNICWSNQRLLKTSRLYCWKSETDSEHVRFNTLRSICRNFLKIIVKYWQWKSSWTWKYWMQKKKKPTDLCTIINSQHTLIDNIFLDVHTKYNI